MRFDAFAPVFRGRTVSGAPPLDAGAVWTLGFVIADRQSGPFRLEVKCIVA
ncbi:MAG: CIA30 family protein [Pseudomonadota bacterium]